MTWVATALLVLGAGTNYVNQKQTAKAQDNQLSRQIVQQGNLHDEANAKIQQALAQRAASTAAPEQQNRTAEYLQAVRASQGKATQGLSQQGAVSDAYRQAANNAALGVSDYSNQTANLMGRIDAPTQQRQREALANSQLSSDLGLIGQRSSSANYLGNLQLQSIRENPYLALASQGLGAAAGAYAGMGMGSDSASSGYLSGQANAATQANNAKLYNNLQTKWAI